MRVLFIGDIVGRSGRATVYRYLPSLRQDLKLDFVVANAENAAGGFGLTPQISDDLFACGIDCLTSGNHIWDQKEIIPHMAMEKRLLRPLNYPAGTPGQGSGLYTVGGDGRVLVVNVMGRVFMDALDDPFTAVDRALGETVRGRDADFILVDVHAEATSEKMAMGQYLDGRASLVVGTHSHVPTADAQILPSGTAYQTDAGMCGDYNSVIGMDSEEPLHRFTQKISRGRFSPALGEGTLCAVFVETGNDGAAERVIPVRLGGCLSESRPTAVD